MVKYCKDNPKYHHQLKMKTILVTRMKMKLDKGMAHYKSTIQCLNHCVICNVKDQKDLCLQLQMTMEVEIL